MKFRGDLYRFVGISLVGVALSVLPAGAESSSSSAGSYKGTPDDFMQISQLFSRYNYTIDNGDGVAWANNFTPDGVFQDPSTCAIDSDSGMVVNGCIGMGCAIFAMVCAYRTFKSLSDQRDALSQGLGRSH